MYKIGEGATVATGDEVQVPVDQIVDVIDNADYEEDTDGGGAIRVPVEDSGASVHVQVLVDEGEGTGQFRLDEEEEVANYIDVDRAAQVQVPVDRGKGAANAPVEAGIDMANDEEGGEVSPIPVDKKAGGLKMMMTKPERFAHGGEGGIAKSMQLCFPVSCERQQARPTW